MKSTSKLVLATLALGAAALMSGCANSAPSGSDPLYSRNNQGFNALGIVDWSPASYEEVPIESAVLYSDTMLDRKNISGDNLSLFWGTFVYADY
ncbi:hypothetical protein [Cerasicoccus arenae]|uniref:Uncharacterized protein n=1 Tax=Cerasicoccus arenae TaxID=424488 RepID=A0A8J3DBW7_9BACT|nr:hypothetical protein [Cerasicoccus arenae]MBK1859651.1 hypothetical protein [Cerasicoccus arenae]GHC07475.1 hypothetical protein GCM10007047_25840 [Cerasicoccus arenae]